MSEFNALTFTYDGISSDKFGLFLCELDNNDINQINETYTVNTLISPLTKEHIFMGYQTIDALTFEIIIASDKIIDAYTRSKINQWLIGRNGFKEFRINAPDYADTFFRCIFTKQETIYIGGYNYALKLTAVCDSPYQYGSSVITDYIANENRNIIINNKSDIDGYIYPNITFTMSETGGNISIINISDNSREFKFTGLSGNESITVDNEKKIITSSLGVYRLGAFNKKWLRFVSGINTLNITGEAEIQIVLPVIKRVGI